MMIWNNPDKWIVLKKTCLAPLYFPWNMLMQMLSLIPFFSLLHYLQWWPEDKRPPDDTPAYHRWRHRNFGKTCERRGIDHRWNGVWAINNSLPPEGKYAMDEILQYKGPALTKEGAFCLNCGSHMQEDMRLGLLRQHG